MREKHTSAIITTRGRTEGSRGTMENCGSYSSDQFQNNPKSHKDESEKPFRGETVVSLEVFGGTEKAGTLQFGEKVGWRKVAIEVYGAMGTRDSWMQNHGSPKLTTFRSKELSRQLAGVWFNIDRRSPSFHREQ